MYRCVSPVHVCLLCFQTCYANSSWNWGNEDTTIFLFQTFWFYSIWNLLHMSYMTNVPVLPIPLCMASLSKPKCAMSASKFPLLFRRGMVWALHDVKYEGEVTLIVQKGKGAGGPFHAVSENRRLILFSWENWVPFQMWMSPCDQDLCVQFKPIHFWCLGHNLFVASQKRSETPMRKVFFLRQVFVIQIDLNMFESPLIII